MLAGPERDTDADWRELGATEPYWGVLTQADYRTENLTPANIEAFYATGQSDMADLVARLKAATGRAPSGRALDFGCGAGRLAEAMCAFAGPVVGYDISPGMLAEARKRGGRAAYADSLPDGPFDWINSFIVFQHIPPARGLALLGELLARLAPGGLISLQLTVWRDDHLRPPAPPAPSVWRRLAAPLISRLRPVERKTGEMQMYDYDFSAVIETLNRGGIGEFSLAPTDHGGHHGVIILGMKADR